jgi:hypothetical protein
VREAGRQRQARLLHAYEGARNRDGRVPLKQGGTGTVIGPVLEFVELQGRPEEAARFTRRYGPLTWSREQLRLVSRVTRPQERERGVSGRSGRRVDREVWRLPIREFWKAHRRFRAVVELATAVQSASDELPRRMRDVLDVLPELAEELGQELGANRERLRANAARYIEEHATSAQPATRTQLMTLRVARVVADILTNAVRQPRVRFDLGKGFRAVPQFGGALDVLYALLVEQLGTLRFCKNCGAMYFKNRPDKNTCGQRCAVLLGKRMWARNKRRKPSRT